MTHRRSRPRIPTHKTLSWRLPWSRTRRSCSRSRCGCRWRSRGHWGTWIQYFHLIISFKSNIGWQWRLPDNLEYIDWKETGNQTMTIPYQGEIYRVNSQALALSLGSTLLPFAWASIFDSADAADIQIRAEPRSKPQATLTSMIWKKNRTLVKKSAKAYPPNTKK